MAEYRSELPERPPYIERLPLDDRGYPVPWFVAWIDGKPEFRAADPEKLFRAVREKLCWVCGYPHRPLKAFLIGPMCTVNRVSAEPPSHVECAQYSARACPFLSKPHMVRRENNMPVLASSAGEMIRRNPGATALWMCRTYTPVNDGKGKMLFEIGEPESVHWYAEGRQATREEVLASMTSGKPILEALCEKDQKPDDSRAALERMFSEAQQYLPA